MKRFFRKKASAVVLSTLLCVPAALGTLAACGGGNGGSGTTEGDTVKQSIVKDFGAVSFTGLSEVEVTDAYCVNAMEKEVEYLLKLNEYKLLYYFYINAGLQPVSQEAYGGGWEGALIGGHTLGHYLTALSQAYANANTSESARTQLKNRISAIVQELKLCQDNAVNAGAKAGFIWGAAPASADRTNVEAQFDFVEQNRANIATEAWVPWYTMHKIIAGLIDVVNYTGDETAKSVVIALGDWVYNRVSKWSVATQNIVLGIEYGGMNDCMYNLYLLTGEEKYAVAAHMFDEEALFNKAQLGSANYLDGLHANTTIPKIIGALNRYVACHGKTIGGETVDASAYLDAAERFWDFVIKRHTYVTGGNSEWEHFGRDNILDRERTNANCETCNTYNMLKLSRMLFTITGDKKYLDYYENTYYNAILSSQNPETGMTTYFQPMATGYFKVYSSEENHFWCCTGSGMESFSKLGDSIYYTAGNATYVSLYVSSRYESDAVTLVQTADLENSDAITVKVESGSTVLRLRRPYWTDTFAVEVNGKEVETTGDEAFVSADVKKDDEVTVRVKKTVRAYNLPDGENTYAFLYGPFVLSAELGDANMSTTTTGVNVTVPARAEGNQTHSVSAASVQEFMRDIDGHMERGENGKFTLVCENGTLTYSVHYRQYTQRYGIYMNFTEGEVKEDVAPWTWETQDTVQPGYGQYENDELHAMTESDTVGATNVAGLGTTRKANAGGSFTYRMTVDPDAQNRLVVTFSKEDNGKGILVKSGSTTLYSETLAYEGLSSSYDVSIDIPQSVLDAAQEISYTDAGGNSVKAIVIPVTFSGIDGEESARVCSYIYSQKRVFNEKAQDDKIAYFVDCGDYDVYTTSAGDSIGKYQSVTEQVYGADAVTGKKWGIVDPHTANIAGAAEKGVATNSTWAYEFNTDDGLDKTASNRYTKNQFESGVARNLHYKFDLDNGTYTVKVYFADPWGCSKNPAVSANGETKVAAAAIGQEISFTVTVTNGELTLDFTSSDLCINLCYITVLFAE